MTINSASSAGKDFDGGIAILFRISTSERANTVAGRCYGLGIEFLADGVSGEFWSCLPDPAGTPVFELRDTGSDFQLGPIEYPSCDK